MSARQRIKKGGFIINPIRGDIQTMKKLKQKLHKLAHYLGINRRARYIKIDENVFGEVEWKCEKCEKYETEINII